MRGEPLPPGPALGVRVLGALLLGVLPPLQVAFMLVVLAVTYDSPGLAVVLAVGVLCLLWLAGWALAHLTRTATPDTATPSGRRRWPFPLLAATVLAAVLTLLLEWPFPLVNGLLMVAVTLGHWAVTRRGLDSV